MLKIKPQTHKKNKYTPENWPSKSTPKKIKALLITPAAILLGCATTPESTINTKPVPKERLLAYQTETEETTAKITITRDKGNMGSGCYYALAINGDLAARLDPSERAIFFLKPGETLLRVGRDPMGKGLCSIGKDDWTQRETQLKPGDIKYFRISIDVNGKTDIQRSEP